MRGQNIQTHGKSKKILLPFYLFFRTLSNMGQCPKWERSPLLSFLFRFISMLVLVLLFSCPLTAFNAVVCECSNATNLGFLQFAEDECSYGTATARPTPVSYLLYFTIPEVKRFSCHICSMWESTTAVYKDFMQWNSVTHSKKTHPG